MPEMNGIEVLEAMRRAGLKAGVIMLSSLTTRGGEMTVRALELGAFDFRSDARDERHRSSRGYAARGIEGGRHYAQFTHDARWRDDRTRAGVGRLRFPI